MTNVLIVSDDRGASLRLYDITTEQNRAKAFTENILLDYARYVIDGNTDLPDTREGNLLTMLLSQLSGAREDAWRMPAPATRNGLAPHFQDKDYTCLAEWVSDWIDSNPEVLGDQPTFLERPSYLLESVAVPSGFKADI